MLPLRNVHHFVDENKNIIDKKVNSYPIHEKNFVKWINNHSPEYQSIASDFRANTVHVSFEQFKQVLGKICAEIRVIKNNYQNIILLLPDLLQKSNFWVSIYMFHYLSDMITHVVTRIDSTSFIDGKTLIIIPDDASYTGKQIVIYASSQTSHDMVFAIPYISRDAKNYIKRSLSNTNNKGNILFCESTIEFKKIKKRYAIYFDHKLADEISTYQLTYALGKDEVTGDPNFVYEPMSLIQGCELYKEVVNPSTFETDNILNVVGSSRMCPPPFYKNIQYMFKNRPINNLSTLMNE
jgi:hypothetical protein